MCAPRILRSVLIWCGQAVLPELSVDALRLLCDNFQPPSKLSPEALQLMCSLAKSQQLPPAEQWSSRATPQCILWLLWQAVTGLDGDALTVGASDVIVCIVDIVIDCTEVAVGRRILEGCVQQLSRKECQVESLLQMLLLLTKLEDVRQQLVQVHGGVRLILPAGSEHVCMDSKLKLVRILLEEGATLNPDDLRWLWTRHEGY